MSKNINYYISGTSIVAQIFGLIFIQINFVFYTCLLISFIAVPFLLTILTNKMSDYLKMMAFTLIPIPSYLAYLLCKMVLIGNIHQTQSLVTNLQYTSSILFSLICILIFLTGLITLPIILALPAKYFLKSTQR